MIVTYYPADNSCTIDFIRPSGGMSHESFPTDILGHMVVFDVDSAKRFVYIEFPDCATQLLPGSLLQDAPPAGGSLVHGILAERDHPYLRFELDPLNDIGRLYLIQPSAAITIQDVKSLDLDPHPVKVGLGSDGRIHFLEFSNASRALPTALLDSAR